VEIYNRKGQKVKTIFQGSQTEGIHCLHWDGCNDLGKELPTGLYFVSLTSEGRSLGRRKISLIK
jgi:flagellar hook assembly protein FlgD